MLDHAVLESNPLADAGTQGGKLEMYNGEEFQRTFAYFLNFHLYFSRENSCSKNERSTYHYC